MKFNRFEVISGRYVEEIPGSPRIGYSMSDTMDFDDMIEWSKRGEYQGSIILFYDYDTGKIYKPFPKQKNVLYGKPVYLRIVFGFCRGIITVGKLLCLNIFRMRYRK